MTSITGLGAKQIQQYANIESGKPKSGLAINTEQKARSTVMSGAEFMEKMGGVPKDSFIIGKTAIFSRSTEYKAAVLELSKFHSMVEALGDHSVADSRGSVGQLKTQLQKVIDAAQAYEDKHAGKDSKADRRNIMADLRDMATKEMNGLDTVVSEMSNQHGGDISLRDALGLYRSGVTDPSQVSKDLTDSNMIGKPKMLGTGQVNQVFIATYGTDLGGKETRVLKPLSERMDNFVGKEKTIGIDANDVRFAARNIASSFVADVMSLGDMIPKADVVLHDGSAFLAMPLAPGESFMGTAEVPIPKEMHSELDLMAKDPESQSYLSNMKAKRKEDGTWTRTDDAPRDFPLETGQGQNPKLTASFQKNLLDLQVLDVLCGQVDRHSFNYFVKIEGDTVKLTGIDNDTAFGKKTTGIKNASDEIAGIGNAPYMGAPPLMSSETFEKLKGIKLVDFGDGLLKSGLDPDEVKAALFRLEKLQDHALELEKKGCIVENFETWRGKDPKSGEPVNVSQYILSCAQNKQGESYLAREIMSKDKNIIGKQITLLPLDPEIHQIK